MADKPSGLISGASESVVLRPPTGLRRLAWVVAVFAGLLLLAAGLALLIGAIMPGLCIAATAMYLAGTTVGILSGRAELRQNGLLSRDDPFRKTSLSWDEIGEFRTRAGLLTESIVAVRAEGAPVTLGAPIRFRFGSAPAFHAAVVELSRRADVSVARGRRSMRRVLIRIALLAIFALLFVKMDPIWHHDRWPGRREADSLPDACKTFAAHARQLFPKLAAHPSPASTTGFIQENDCNWGGSSLSLHYTLFRYALGQDGGIEHAKRWYREQTPQTTADTNVSLHGLGDRALLTVSGTVRARQIQITARKGNVVAWIVYMPPAGKDAKDTAVAAAEQMAREALGEVVLH
ncbi:hypothetical protein [Actinoallomurus acaciae]|uniref:PH domain-containing protein n=1 Tax=Actinoallomurus acaciae TaxID=502577 RepID=A0ABV5YH04_9ACTN